MGPIAKRTLFAIMVVVSLLTACASAPAATEEPELIRQFIEQSIASTVAALPPSEAPEPIQDVPNVSASTTPPGEPVSSFPDVEDVLPPATEPESDLATSDEEDWGQDYCEVFLQSTLQVKENEINRFPRRLEVGMKAVVRSPVNLRTQPGLRSRILLTLKPDTEVEIIAGPIKTPVETHFQNGTKYVWWQVKLPGGLTGWSAELSVCRQFYFMEPVQ